MTLQLVNQTVRCGMADNVIQIAEQTKVCSKCKVAKARADFHKSKVFADGLKTECKDCRHKQYRAARPHQEDLRQNVELIADGRVCLSCKEGKAWDSFPKDIHGYNQKSATCRDCRNAKGRQVYRDNPAVRRSGLKNRPDKLLRFYGITYEDVVRTLNSQHGLCANRGCGREISLDVSGPVKTRAVIDHCHNTGKFRALLCTSCNTILGTIESKRNLVVGLIEYALKFNKSD